MFEDVIQGFHKDLNAKVMELSNPIRMSEMGVALSDQVISILKDKVEKVGFRNPEEEIDFFKRIKPDPMSYYIYFSEVRSFEMRKPKVGNEFQLQFIEKELKKINKFFLKNSYLVQYMEQGYSHLDQQFFTRNSRRFYPLMPLTCHYQYPGFSSSHDFMWSQVQAMNRFTEYLDSLKKKLTPGEKDPAARQLTWSGSKANLVELIYALQASAEINSGAVDLKTLTSAFEDIFQIGLDNVYKSYSEIKARKGPRAKFLRKLLIDLENRMERDDEK